MGNVTVTLGTGAPHRLLVAPMDEPGYVVSHIEDDGYLRVTRLPQTGLPPHYNEMQNAQPMVVETLDGKQRSAVVAGLSIHLTPGRASLFLIPTTSTTCISISERGPKQTFWQAVSTFSARSP